MTVPAAWSALVVAVPEAEPVIGRHRLRHDPAATHGVGTHVTVLFPFVPPGAIDETVLTRLEVRYADVPAFDARFGSFGRFPGVLWLHPEPVAMFRLLLDATFAAFAELPPYGGVHDRVVPHMTIGEVDGATADDLEEQIARFLPVVAAIERVTLIGADGGPASVLARFALAGAQPDTR